MQAFILRIAPSGKNRVKEALDSDSLMIGWSEARGLLDEKLTWEQFRRIVHDVYYKDDNTFRGSGQAASQLWRFIRDMKCGNLVVVPDGPEFYVATVTSNAEFLEEKVGDDIAYRRSVEWLNNKKAIPRKHARAALTSRMKHYGTCVSATDLVDQINECLTIAKSDKAPTFKNDLRQQLAEKTLEEIRIGRMDDRKFEELIKNVLHNMGATQAKVIPRSKDEGADVIAEFNVAGNFIQKVAVQAKHWKPDPPVDAEVIKKLGDGIEAEGAHFGMVITTGTFSKEAEKCADEYFNSNGVEIALIDGETFAKMVIEHYVNEPA